MTFSKLIRTLSTNGEVPEGTRLPDPRIRVQSAEGHVPKRADIGGETGLRDAEDLSSELELPSGPDDAASPSAS
jgi:hypothetical protein